MKPATTSNKKSRQRKAYKTSDILKRAKSCSRRVFTIKEDKIIIKFVLSPKFNNDWNAVANLLPSRSARQCRDRWTYYLSPTNSLLPFTSEEDQLIIQKVNELGKKWTKISKFFPGRSDNSIKNRWYSKLASKCVVDEFGFYSIVQNKLVDELKMNDHVQESCMEYNIGNPKIVNNYFSMFPLKITQNQDYNQIRNPCTFWNENESFNFYDIS